MELLLLLGFGAYLLSRQNGGTTPPPTPPPSGSGSGSGAGQAPTQGTQVELSSVRLPSIIVGGKPQPLINLPFPANVVYSNYFCKQPGGAFRSVDILDKLNAFIIAYDMAVAQNAFQGAPLPFGKNHQLRQAVENAKKAYQSAVQFHFTQCSNYDKQL